MVPAPPEPASRQRGHDRERVGLSRVGRVAHRQPPPDAAEKRYDDRCIGREGAVDCCCREPERRVREQGERQAPKRDQPSETYRQGRERDFLQWTVPVELTTRRLYRVDGCKSSGAEQIVEAWHLAGRAQHEGILERHTDRRARTSVTMGRSTRRSPNERFARR